MTSYNDGPTSSNVPSISPPRRFSEGIEREPLTPSVRRVGRFSDGLARSGRRASETPVGSFADGITHARETRSARRIGSFSDAPATAGAASVTVPRVDSARSSAAGRIAA